MPKLANVAQRDQLVQLMAQGCRYPQRYHGINLNDLTDTQARDAIKSMEWQYYRKYGVRWDYR